MITAKTSETQMIDNDDGNGPQPHTLVSAWMPVSDAEALAAAKIERGDSSLLVADCRPVATAIAAALVAAGLGRG